MSAKKAIKAVSRFTKGAVRTISDDPLGAIKDTVLTGGVGLAAKAAQGGVGATAGRTAPLPQTPGPLDQGNAEDDSAARDQAAQETEEDKRRRRGSASTQVSSGPLSPNATRRRSLLGA